MRRSEVRRGKARRGAARRGAARRGATWHSLLRCWPLRPARFSRLQLGDPNLVSRYAVHVLLGLSAGYGGLARMPHVLLSDHDDCILSSHTSNQLAQDGEVVVVIVGVGEAVVVTVAKDVRGHRAQRVGPKSYRPHVVVEVLLGVERLVARDTGIGVPEGADEAAATLGGEHVDAGLVANLIVLILHLVDALLLLYKHQREDALHVAVVLFIVRLAAIVAGLLVLVPREGHEAIESLTILHTVVRLKRALRSAVPLDLEPVLSVAPADAEDGLDNLFLDTRAGRRGRGLAGRSRRFRNRLSSPRHYSRENAVCRGARLANRIFRSDLKYLT